MKEKLKFQNKNNINYLLFKNHFDKFLAIIIFLILSPIFLLVSLLVFLNFGYPIFFIQDRPGYKNKIFKIFKFKTMKDFYDEKGKILSDNLRINKFGRWLRSTSLDELPELINIIKGEMSFIGPRPLLKEYLEYYSDEEITRHNVKPGITGLAQINGRNLLSWEERFKLDIYYKDNLSFRLDLIIIFKTILIVLKKEGISAKGNVTMYPFKRSKN